MSKIEGINPNRLKWCCAAQGTTLEQLAEDANVPWPNLQKVLEGKAGLTFPQLRKIAEYFGRGLLFFLDESDPDPERVLTPQFRTLNNQKTDLLPRTRRLIEDVEWQRDVFLGLVENLENAPPKPLTRPALPNGRVPAAAAEVRQWLGLKDQRDFVDYRRAVEEHGILVFVSSGYAGKWQVPRDETICGFAIEHPVCPLIFVRKQRAPARQTFTLMHELGHLLIHRGSFIDDDHDLLTRSGREFEANQFAGHVLVPPALLDLIDATARPGGFPGFDDWLKPVRLRSGVSNDVILIRLIEAGRIDQRVYDQYRDWRSQQSVDVNDSGNRQYRHREPVHLFGDRFVRTVLDAFHARNITLNRASTYLDNLKIVSMHKLEREYAHP